jgi:hypothetical protein
MDRRFFAVLMLAGMFTTACPPPQPTPSLPPSLSPATGYAASCAGESVTLTLNAGQTGGFQAICTNTGTNSWTRGTPTEASLVPCCPVGGSAPFPGWAANSARYPQSTTVVAPGSNGFFLFNVTVPSGTPRGTYTSYAALVNASNQPISAQVLAFTVIVP